MMIRALISVGLLASALNLTSFGAVDDRNNPDITTVPMDLTLPKVSAGDPAAGKLVMQSLPSYAGTEVAHGLYLPTDWEPGKRYPVMVEYNGNGRRVREPGGLGYGISGGKGFIWVVLPYVSVDHKKDMDWWWGDVEATVAYAKVAVPAICRQWGGDPARVILLGHSRGAIACNYIGLHDDEIARLWRGMIPFSHYHTDSRAWGMKPEDTKLSVPRLRRLGSVPQLICGEHHLARGRHEDAKLLEMVRQGKFDSFEKAKKELGLAPMLEQEGIVDFVTRNYPGGRYTFLNMPYVNHSSDYVLRDIPQRQQMRAWVQEVLRGESGEKVTK